MALLQDSFVEFMEKQLPKPKIKKPPFFKSGALVFDESGHKLVLSGKYYRCVKDSNGKCNAVGEGQVNARTLERTFSRLMKNFAIEKTLANELVNKITKENLFEILIETDEKEAVYEELTDNAVELMKRDIEHFKKDSKDFDIYFRKQIESSFPVLLFGQLIGILRVLAHPEREAELARNLSLCIKQIRLSKKGRIVYILFEPWAWYVMTNVLDKNIPNYLYNVKKKVVILNKAKDSPDLSIKEMALAYGSDILPNAMGENFTMSVGLIDFMKKTLRFALQEDPHEIVKNLPVLLEYVKNNPILMLVTQVVAFTNSKIESKNQSDPLP